MLDELGLEVIPQTALNIPDIEETGLTFVENSILKARNAAALSNLPAIADDSGFGYDPLFQVTETNCRAAELDKQTKNRLSHRGKAMANLMLQLQHQ